MPPSISGILREARARKVGWYRVIQELRKGPLTPKQLENRGIPARTVYRALYGLKMAGVVEERNGKWYWYELRRRTFDSHEEYESAKQHSEKLCPMLEESILLGEKMLYSGEEKEESKCALDHLNAYPEILKILNDCKRRKEEFKQRESEVKTEIVKLKGLKKLKKLIGEGFGNPSENIAHIIVESLKDLAWEREPFFKNLRIEGETLRCGAWVLAPKELESEVRKMIERACQSKRKLGKELAQLCDEYYGYRSKLTRELIHLVNLVKHGTPLLGKCALCPTFKIKPPKGEEVRSHESEPHRSEFDC